MNLIVTSNSTATLNGKDYRCALGPNGIGLDKKEGDGKTPAGTFPIRKIFYRADRMAKPNTGFPVQSLSEDDGWCDDVNDPKYNQEVKLPYTASHEKLWREDNLYDIIVVLGYNDDPPVPGKGSAIFMHIARPAFTPTGGCIAFSKPDLLEILAIMETGSQVEVKL